MHANSPIKNESSMEDRLEYLYTNLVGQVVRVHTVDGCVTEGLFLSRIDDDQHPSGKKDDQVGGIILRFHRRCVSKHHSVDQSAKYSRDDLLFCYSEIVYVEAVNLRIRMSTPGSGQVQQYTPHDLEKMDWAVMKEELLETDEKEAQWDQFKTNEKMFGVVSTFKEEIYTTKLNPNEFTREQLNNADKVARQIENSAATHGIGQLIDRGTGGGDVDDALYSDVIRPDAKQEPKGQRDKKTAASNRQKASRGNDASETGSPVAADFNPSAQPFLPSRPVCEDFMKAIANAISSNEHCYECPDMWPGEENHVPDQPAPQIPFHQPLPNAPFAQGNMHQGFPQMNPFGNAMGHPGPIPPMMHPPFHRNSHGSYNGYMDPNQMMIPSQGPGGPPFVPNPGAGPSGTPNPVNPNRAGGRAKTTQPQQPVSVSPGMGGATSSAAAAPPIANIDSTAGQEKPANGSPAPQKKMRRGASGRDNDNKKSGK